MMALKRANPEDGPTFFAVRGKKNVLKPNSLFGAFGAGKRSMKPNSLFSSIPGRRSPIGKRSSMKPNSLFSAIPAGKRGGFNSLKPNSLFGSFSKRSIKPNGLFGLRMQRGAENNEPMDLFSVGKKNSLLVCGPEDSRCFKWSMPRYALEQSSLDPEEETFVVSIEDEEDLEERVKRGDDAGDFWATRGKRDSADLDFWATRG